MKHTVTINHCSPDRTYFARCTCGWSTANDGQASWASPRHPEDIDRAVAEQKVKALKHVRPR